MELKVTRYELREDGVATVWLSRPGRGNSWTSRMNAELRWIMATLDADPAARAVVLTGEGRQFCVGADTQALDYYTETDEDYRSTVDKPEMARPGYGVREEFDHDLAWLWGMRLPVIAAINGACAGIAVGIAGFCDLRYSVEGAKFTTATPRLGLPAEYGLAWVLPRVVGLSHAADILITGRILAAEEMDRMGFINEVLPDDEGFLDAVRDKAAYIATRVSPDAATIAKRQIYAEIMRHDVGAAIEDSKDLIEVYMKRPDFAEGVASMAQKRRPDFGAPLDLPSGPTVAQGA